jgi:hypothetical protein
MPKEEVDMRDLVTALREMVPALALTPEKIREALKPYEDPAIIAREKRSREQNRKQFLEDMKAKAERQSRCPHKDKNMRWAINLVHNFPDAKPRGICPLCEAFLQPAHYDFKAPTDEHPDGERFIIPAHPQYHIVLELESMA